MIWFIHENSLYNLSQCMEIRKYDEESIILYFLGGDEVLDFDSEEEREQAWMNIMYLTKVIGD